MVGTGIGTHKKANNPQLEGEDPGSGVHGRESQKRQNEQGIRIGTKENVK